MGGESMMGEQRDNAKEEGRDSEPRPAGTLYDIVDQLEDLRSYRSGQHAPSTFRMVGCRPVLLPLVLLADLTALAGLRRSCKVDAALQTKPESCCAIASAVQGRGGRQPSPPRQVRRA